MATVRLPAQLADQSLAAQDTVIRSFTEMLPLMFVSLLERRYLSNFQISNWRIEGQEGDTARPLLREVTDLGRPRQEGEWARAMPHVLTACHDPGHAVIMALHGHGDRHRLYLGGRRIIGAGARSTEAFMLRQESAFKAYFAGLQMSPMARLDSTELPEMARFLQTAPALAAVTGIPSGRGGPLPLALQSVDRLVKAVGDQRYVLLVVAESIEPWVIDATLDACRRLKSEVHAYVRRTISQSRGESESESLTEQDRTDTGKEYLLNMLPSQLSSLASFSLFAGYPWVGGLAMLLSLVPTLGIGQQQVPDFMCIRERRGSSTWAGNRQRRLSYFA